MGAALAPSLVLSLAALASADVELGIRAEGRTHTLAPSGASAHSGASLAATPRAAVLVDVERLRLSSAYSSRVWTSDVEARPSPIVTHDLDLRLETSPDRTWRVAATARGSRGRSDPLSDPWAAIAPEAPAQLASTEPIPFEAIRTGARAQVELDPRTALEAAAGWQLSRGASAEARTVLPVQRGVALDGSVRHLVTEVDTVRLSGTAARTLTSRTDGEATAAFASASATWRRRTAPTVVLWLGGGAAVAYEDAPQAHAERDVLPVAQAGIAREADGPRVAVEMTARLAPFVDRFSGDVSPMADAALEVRSWATPRIALAASASAGARTDGETALALVGARVTWAPRERAAVHVGVIGRWQHERRPGVPSFFEGGVFAAVAYDTGPL